MKDTRNRYEGTEGKLRSLSHHLDKRIVTSADLVRPIFDGRSMRTVTKITPGHERIAKRAYAIWQDNGCPPDQDRNYWLQAEAELSQGI